MGKKTKETNVFRDILDVCISIYMLLLIVAMPLYFEEGYTHIGTDKATFFRECSTKAWMLLIPMMAFGVGINAIVKGVNRQSGDKKRKNGRKVVRAEAESLSDGKQTWIQRVRNALQGMPKLYLFAGWFIVALLISYLCSDYQSDALWGVNGWYMGLLPQLMFVGIFLLIAFGWKGHQWISYGVLPISFGVFLLGYLNRFAVYPIDMKVAQGNFLSTIGNINWFCGYMVSVFFAGFYLLWRRQEWKLWQQVLLSIYVLMGFATLVAQGSSSGILTLAVVLLVTFCMSVSDGQAMENFLWEVVLFALPCLMTWGIRQMFPERFTLIDGIVELLTNSKLPIVMTVVSVLLLALVVWLNQKKKYPQKAAVFCGYLVGIGACVGVLGGVCLIWYNTTHPGVLAMLADSSVFTFDNNWGSYRGVTWRAGWMCFLEQSPLHKLVGTGSDCMSAFLYDQGSAELVEMVKMQFHESVLTNAHNEWLTVLVDVGLLGAIGYIGMMVSAIVRFLKHGRKEVMAGACGMCVLAFTVNNMFSFQQSLNMATIFVIMGIGEYYCRKTE